jgi:Protein of unknown function (DUF2635)
MWVKPAPGRTVRDPRSMAKLPDEGREVPDGDLFWVRRIRDGDVTVEEHAAHRRRSAPQEPRREA